MKIVIPQAVAAIDEERRRDAAAPGRPEHCAGGQWFGEVCADSQRCAIVPHSLTSHKALIAPAPHGKGGIVRSAPVRAGALSGLRARAQPSEARPHGRGGLDAGTA
ncbi:MAG: hypothetical protein AUK55_01685 [Syntrophobacteraceae bacterium CG2_30_61_12]|nr:MAG: hypothetical protein AUK55_01685 [Syntrophobacteraceae bacterium CG2_30_61_12]